MDAFPTRGLAHKIGPSPPTCLRRSWPVSPTGTGLPVLPGILRLGKQYSPTRLEAACGRAVALQACSYQSVKSILKCNLDSLPVEPAEPAQAPSEHPNIRGSEYFDSGEPPTLQ